MANADRDHFDTYPEQTRVKHQILEQYWKPYLEILGERHKKIFFLDGFAGRGVYDDLDQPGEVKPGSPIIAMEIAASIEKVRSNAEFIFIEKRGDHFECLEKVAPAKARELGLKPPHLVHGEFAEVISDELKEFDESSSTRIAPTFAFVDPCGVSGVSLSVIADIARRQWCEAFIFFNYTGVRRVAGLLEKDADGPTLSEIYGGQERVELLRNAIKGVDAQRAEETLVGFYLDALRQETNAKYVLPFRIECAHKQSTSHYLIHVTKNPTAFRIMKSVMWKAAQYEDGDIGRLEYLQRSSGRDLIRPDLAMLSEEIVRELRQGARSVSFIGPLVERPTDLFSVEAYKHCLLQLEEAGKIEVLDKNGKVVPASKRLRSGKVTLGDTKSVRLIAD